MGHEILPPHVIELRTRALAARPRARRLWTDPARRRHDHRRRRQRDDGHDDLDDHDDHLGDHDGPEGKLTEAHARLIEGTTIFKSFGDKRRLAHAHIVLARVLLAQGDPAAAEALTRETEAELARQGSRDFEALAAIVRAGAVAAQGRHDEVAQLLAPHLARRSESPEVRTRLAIAAGDPVLLDEAIRDDTELGLALLAREARTARARLQRVAASR